MTKRLFCALLCLILLIGALPVSAMAIAPTPTYADALRAASTLSGIRDNKDVGGIYMTEDQTHLAVLLVHASNARKNEIRAMVENPDALIFKSAKYSYTELKKLCTILSSNVGFDLTGCGVDEMNNCVLVEVYYDGVEAARAYYAKYKDRVMIVGSDFSTVGERYAFIQISNEQWIRDVFPGAKEFSTQNTRFVFSGAPRAIKTRAVLSKLGESISVYRFENNKDYAKAKAMIRGTTVVSGSSVVYVDTPFASTYFYHDDSNMLALYCGSAQSVFPNLKQSNFYPAGGLGGFFANRNLAIYKNAAQRIEPNGKTPASPEALRTASTAVLAGKVKNVPTATGVPGVYTITVGDSIRGSLKGTISVTAMPGVLEKGRSYVLFLKKDAKGIYRLTDEAYFSVFEINDKGFVLPIREYGMTKPVTFEAFKKSL